jgi:hypothetical protein
VFVWWWCAVRFVVCLWFVCVQLRGMCVL